jgi:hypothetical protein
MDDVLKSLTVQAKSRFVRLILYNTRIVSKHEGTHGVYLRVSLTLATFK